MAAAATVRLEVEDLSLLPHTECSARAKLLAEAEARELFNLTQSPLVRAKLLRLAPDDCLLLLTWHHIASDGWSMGVFYRELTTLYEAFAQGRPSPLAEPPITYSDYAVWQRARIDSAAWKSSSRIGGKNWRANSRRWICRRTGPDRPRRPTAGRP